MGESYSSTGSSSSTCAHNLNMQGQNTIGPMMAEKGLVDLPFGALEGSGGLPAALAASSLRRLRSCTPACQRRFWCLIHAAGSSYLQCSQINALLHFYDLKHTFATSPSQQFCLCSAMSGSCPMTMSCFQNLRDTTKFEEKRLTLHPLKFLNENVACMLCEMQMQTAAG